jgi:tRNA(Ile)-lysidine synthase
VNNLDNHIDYWIACSGGVDSVVLVRLFKELNKSFGILHCNFKLRGNASDKDEKFVRDLADEINVPVQVKNFDIQEYIKKNGGNTQLAARNLRYQWFEDVKYKSNAKIVLGHHKDDQIETFYLQLRRGGKLKGLSSMPFSHKGYIRPLLKYSKDEIYSLAKKNDWLWREDLSNQESNYLRNYYRNILIPFLSDNQVLKTQVIELVNDFQELLKFSEHYLTRKFDFSEEIKVNFTLWESWPYWLKHLLISKSGISPISVKEVDRLRSAEKGKYIKNESRSIWNEGDGFYIRIDNNPNTFSEYNIELITVKGVKFREGEVFIDKDKVQGTISLRAWKEGDSFQPIGMSRQKKVSKFLRDRKVPSSEKKNYPVIVDGSSCVIGVAEMCPDERFKVDENTKWIYVIKKELNSSN